MFTLEAINEAHSKVKSGADFPQYINDLKQVWVSNYSTFVNDGNTIYNSTIGDELQTGAKYPDLAVADKSNPEQFLKQLKAHQAGQTDYPTFCNDCAVNGIEKWTVDIKAMTCTYYDKATNEILVEQIPKG
jgi:uncharacterized protein YbcV (DUF1398 family)